MIAALFAAALATAALSWEAPTQNVDGTPISGIQSYEIAYGPASGTYTEATISDIDPALLELEVTFTSPGERFFVIRVEDTLGRWSAWSNEVSKDIQDEGPVPVVFTLQDETVYTVVKQPNRFVLIPVGSVPAGTMCDMNHSANGHGAVPTSAVQWTSTARPIVVVARCDG